MRFLLKPKAMRTLAVAASCLIVSAPIEIGLTQSAKAAAVTGGHAKPAAAAANAAKPQAPPAVQVKDDTVLKALKDEMQRSMTRLHLDKYKGPYFIDYTVHENDTFGVTGSFGAIDENRRDRRRSLSVDVREGDYSLDSSQFAGGGGFGFGMGGRGYGGNAITVDDNYDALRHELWLRTDSAYKRAIEDLEGKKAFLAENNVKDRPDSMSKEQPVVSISPVALLNINEEKATQDVRNLSSLFREYPRIQKSIVSLDADAETRWFMNSEGFLNRTPKSAWVWVAMASAQADDGAIVSDLEMVSGQSEKEIPPYAELEKKTRALADRVTKLAQAKTVEEYRGPILFEGQAAGEFFSQSLQQHLGHTSEPLNKKSPFSEFMKNPLENKLGLRILPTFISIYDDPLTKQFGKKEIMSSYDIDDDGMRGQKVTLVDKGILKSFCMSRVPSREIKHSNGHSRGGMGVASNLYIVSDSKMTPAQLKQKLIEFGKEDGLPYVFLVRRLWNFGCAALEPGSLMSTMMGSFAGGSDVHLLPPVMLYKVSTADGHEELMRGGAFSNLTMRVLRDISATGNDANAYALVSMANIMNMHTTPELSTVVTPSVLVREVEIQKPSKQTELPPILKNPFFDKSLMAQ